MNKITSIRQQFDSLEALQHGLENATGVLTKEYYQQTSRAQQKLIAQQALRVSECFFAAGENAQPSEALMEPLRQLQQQYYAALPVQYPAVYAVHAQRFLAEVKRSGVHLYNTVRGIPSYPQPSPEEMAQHFDNTNMVASKEMYFSSPDHLQTALLAWAAAKMKEMWPQAKMQKLVSLAFEMSSQLQSFVAENNSDAFCDLEDTLQSVFNELPHELPLEGPETSAQLAALAELMYRQVMVVDSVLVEDQINELACENLTEASEAIVRQLRTLNEQRCGDITRQEARAIKIQMNKLGYSIKMEGVRRAPGPFIFQDHEGFPTVH